MSECDHDRSTDSFKVCDGQQEGRVLYRATPMHSLLGNPLLLTDSLVNSGGKVAWLTLWITFALYLYAAGTVVPSRPVLEDDEDFLALTEGDTVHVITKRRT